MNNARNDLDLDSFRAAYAFYYERAAPLEILTMDLLCQLRVCLTVAVHGSRRYLPSQALGHLEKTTNVLEVRFVEVVALIRSEPTFSSLTNAQRMTMEAECFMIEFLE
ncbi:MAG: hypothetical protein ABIZ81_08605 [Opitutaceae bacterium]